jgi:tetratricopeptide (TPR) repeat protein
VIGRGRPAGNGSRSLRRRTHAGLADTLCRLKRYREALEDWTAALEGISAVDEPEWWLGRARCQALAGQAEEAMKGARAVEKGKDLNGRQLYNLACIAALSSTAARNGGNASLADSHARAALGFLEQARKARLFDDPEMVRDLKEDGDFKGLAKRPDFVKFVQSLEGKKPR